MSSPLDRIEAEAKARQYAVALHGGDQATQDWAAIAVSTGDVLALVNIAKAAQEMREWLWEEAERDAPPHGWRAREELIEKTDEAFARLCIRLNKKKG